MSDDAVMDDGADEGARRRTRAERRRAAFREFQRLNPNEVPDAWTPEYVGVRLRQAFETLRHLPEKEVARGHGQGWPSYVYEAEDLRAQQEQAAAEEEAGTAEPARIRLPVPSSAISRMEEALAWPGRHLAHDPALAKLVMHVAIAQARRVSIKALCQRMKWNDATVRRRRQAGLTIIASALAQSSVPIR